MSRSSPSPLMMLTLAGLSCSTCFGLYLAMAGITPPAEPDLAPRNNWKIPQVINPAPAPTVNTQAGQNLARPSFFKSRRPFESESPALATTSADVAQKTATNPVLSGIILMNGVRTAYFTASNLPDGLWARSGDQIGDFKIESIDVKSVLATRNGNTIKIELAQD